MFLSLCRWAMNESRSSTGILHFKGHGLFLGTRVGRDTSTPSFLAKEERHIVYSTLRQTCSRDQGPRAPFAFKDSMIHCLLQFTLLIAVGCVLHRCVSQEIHRSELFSLIFYVSFDHSHHFDKLDGKQRHANVGGLTATHTAFDDR